MVIEIYGDALKNDCDVLCHQVNLQGAMGGGIAAQIAYKYPQVEDEYVRFSNKILGEVCFAKADKYVVANCFSQDWDFATDYNALRCCAQKVNKFMDKNGYISVAFPYHYGCGIARGDWEKVLDIIYSELSDKTIKIYHRQ